MSEKNFYCVVADGSQAMWRAISYCENLSKVNGFGIYLLHITDDSEFSHWLGVGSIIKQEAEVSANKLLNQIKQTIISKFPEIILIYHQGDTAHDVYDLVSKIHEIKALVLGMDNDARDPGKIISYLAQSPREIKTPVIIVPINSPINS